jgi:hypothetical protein
MKKLFFLFIMLAGITASATVKVTPLATDYAAQKVTFKVEWTGTAANNRVWVWVDLCPVVGTTAGIFAKAEISNPSAIVGNIAIVTGNTRGFYVTVNPSTVTAILSNTTGNFNWCAYGSDYPPNATSYNSGTYTLKGTQPFLITGNGTIQNGNKYVGTVINSLTDATGCPGGVGRDQPHNGGTCAPGLTAVGNYCRDLVADGASAVTTCNYEIKNGQPNVYTNSSYVKCPSGWRLPTISELTCLCKNKASVSGVVFSCDRWCTSTLYERISMCGTIDVGVCKQTHGTGTCYGVCIR